jgi:hypothetical protein
VQRAQWGKPVQVRRCPATVATAAKPRVEARIPASCQRRRNPSRKGGSALHIRKHLRPFPISCQGEGFCNDQ